MKKVISLFLTTVFVTLSAVAQNQQHAGNNQRANEAAAKRAEEAKEYYANADTAQYGVRYRMKYNYNKDKKLIYEEDRVVLISPDVTLDMSYESIGEHRWRLAHPDGKTYDMTLAYHLTPSYYFFYPATGRMVETYRIASDEFKLNDSKCDNNWNQTSETRKIGDYNCRKATLEKGGRQWTAWFTNDLPGVGAPRNFNGLPGVVLEITDADNDVAWHFNGIVNNIENDTLFIKYPDKFTDIPVKNFPKIVKILALSPKDYLQKAGVLSKSNSTFPEKYLPSTGLDACNITNPIER